jgi:hypothetical protein
MSQLRKHPSGRDAQAETPHRSTTIFYLAKSKTEFSNNEEKKKVRWRRDMIDKQAQMLGRIGMERPGFSNKSAKEIKVGALWADGWVSKRLIL